MYDYHICECSYHYGRIWIKELDGYFNVLRKYSGNFLESVPCWNVHLWSKVKTPASRAGNVGYGTHQMCQSRGSSDGLPFMGNCE